MARSRFDPSKMKTPQGPLSGPTLPGFQESTPPPAAPLPPDDSDGAGGAGGERPLSVSQLASVIERALRVGVPAPIKVVGEVSGFRDRTHWWFDLKDEGAVVSCAMFRSAAAKAGFAPTNGQEVLVRGRVAFYDKQGKTQIYVDSITPVGAGELDAKFRALCEELRGLGWFDDARKRPLPWFPRKVAVITSRTGAALQDVLNTMGRRCPTVSPVIVDVRVQGDRAAPEVVAAIDWVSREHESMGVDAIIVTRGGGSMEHLWAFNERAVAEAIVRCSIPLVAAIGHESDTTIAELVADERCSTPTQAAMRLTPDRASLTEQITQLEQRLTNGLRSSVRHEVGRVRAIISHPIFSNPRGPIQRSKGRLDGGERDLVRGLRARIAAAHLRVERLAARVHAGRPEAVHAGRTATVREVDARLRSAMHRALERRGDRLSAYLRELSAVGPMQVLARGYSVTLDPNGRAVRDPAQVAPGETIESRVLEGTVRSTVIGADAKPLPRKQAPPPRTSPNDADPGAEQMDLF